MSVLNGFTKYKNYKADSSGDHKLTSFWTSSDTVEGSITEASTRTNLANGETLSTSLGKVKKFFTDLGTAAFKSTTDSYDGTSSDPITGKGVKAAIEGLDVNEVGGFGKYISTISETDGKISATAGNIDSTVTQSSTNLITSGAVWTAIDNLPEPLVFKGTLGAAADSPTITSLPTASSSNEGWTYLVVTDGTYASQAAKVGDKFACATLDGGTTYQWIWFKAGDPDTDTWRNIKVNGTEKLGNGISSGGVDFVNGTNTTVSFDATGNKVSVSVPAVSTTSAGVAPKGNAVSTQSQSTKFLREDGSWAAPSYTTDTNTTYTFAQGTNNGEIKITPSSGTATTVIPKGLSDLAYVSKGSGSSKYLREDGTWQEVTGGVSSVNTKTGDVVLTASDVGALASNGTAAKATADADGNTISSTYMKQGVDYVTAGKKADTTLGSKATAEGSYTTASGDSSHAEGSGTVASALYAHAEGSNTTASKQSAHAEGGNSKATGYYSHAEGFNATASNTYAHAEGYSTIAAGEAQHVEGKFNVEDTNGTYAHIIGGGTSIYDHKNIFTVDWNGVTRDGTENRLLPFKAVSEAEYAALSQAEKTNGTAYFRYEANGIMREIQDNGSATSLTSGALPTGQTIESYLNSNIVNAGSNQINFSTTPQTYATSGSMWVQIIGKVCILSFVDLGISNSPTNNAVLIASNLIPISKYQVSSILIDSTGTGGVQKVMIGANTNSIYNYWTSDSIRKNGYFHGQLVYIIA